MARQRTSKRRDRIAALPVPTSPPRRPRLWVVGGGALVVVAAILLFGNRWVANLANERARQELAAQHVEEAIQWLEWSLEWHHSNAETELMLARASRRRGRFAEFYTHLGRARELGLTDSRHRCEQLLAQAQTGDIPAPEMEKHLAILLTDPDNDAAEVSEAFANGYLVNQRYTEAMRLLDAWHLDYPEAAQPHYMRGLIWHYLGSLDAAEQEFRRALELQPTHYPAAMALGDFLVKRRRVNEAIPYFELCTGATYEGSAARVRVAQCLRLLGQHDEARSRIEQVLVDDPDMLAAGVELAELDVGAGAYERAVPWLRRAVKENPRDIEVRYALATVLAASGNSDEAQLHFNFVNKARPAVNRARELIIGLNDEPNDTAARVEIGKLLLEYGSQREGVFWLKSALSIDPKCQPAHRALLAFYEPLAAHSSTAAEAAHYHKSMIASEESNEPENSQYRTNPR